jgi:hypothetical protein
MNECSSKDLARSRGSFLLTFTVPTVKRYPFHSSVLILRRRRVISNDSQCAKHNNNHQRIMVASHHQSHRSCAVTAAARIIVGVSALLVAAAIVVTVPPMLVQVRNKAQPAIPLFWTDFASSHAHFCLLHGTHSFYLYRNPPRMEIIVNWPVLVVVLVVVVVLSRAICFCNPSRFVAKSIAIPAKHSTKPSRCVGSLAFGWIGSPLTRKESAVTYAQTCAITSRAFKITCRPMKHCANAFPTTPSRRAVPIHGAILDPTIANAIPATKAIP